MNQNYGLAPRRQALALALSAAFAATAPQAAAQESMTRVEITGSSIKRIADESALPVQVIKREDIEKSGVTTAAELLKNISANTAPLSDGASITDGTSGQRGFNGANLRGLGVSSTLVLLNGRRLANFASPGDNAGVDLNNIPAGAIQRVEVLKDGASAIYGTDAIGGVINFITRTNYQGLDLNASVAATQHGGAGKKTLSIGGGKGDLENDGFNLFGVLDAQQLESLRSSQRDFIAERPLATTLPALMSSYPYPGNIDISSAQRNALIQAGVLPAGSTGTRINPSAPGCNPPASVYVPAGPGGRLGCGYDYMQDTELYPESRKLGFVGRASVKVGADHQVFAELVQSRAESSYVLSPNNLRVRNVPVSVLPQQYRAALSAPGLPATVNGIRVRMTEAGNRSNEVTSDAQRLVLGASGLVAGWDYGLGVSRAENKVRDRYFNGYTLFDKLEQGIKTGVINPFGPSSQAGLDLLASIRVADAARSSKGVSTAVDGKLTRSLMALGGGDLGVAIGGELRRERMTFTPSALLLSNNIAGDRSSSGLGVAELVATRDSRRVASLYAEAIAPFTKELEMQFAVRHDDYSDAGSSTNPKVGVRWQPQAGLVLRGSANSGFRAPSLSDLNRPTTYGSASSFLTDPQCVAEGLDSIDGCTDQYPVERRSNRNLKPEKSRQFALGAVWEAAPGASLSLDYWNIEKRDVISTLGEQVIVDSPAKYNGTYIQRDEDGFITNILLQKENQGRLKTSGLDLGADWRGANGPMGRFSASLSGTYILKYDRQFGPLEGYRSNLGRFLNDQVIQRWRHRVSLGWDMAKYNLTLANQYSTSYVDQNTTYDPAADQLLPSRRVKAYSLWDLTGSVALSRNLKLRAGVLNLLDADPPFSNQAYYFLAGYDPTYTDPRGRSAFVSVNYSFR